MASQTKETSFDQGKLTAFLHQTKEEKFGKVERSSLKYVRIKEVAVPSHENSEEDYYFSVDSVR